VELVLLSVVLGAPLCLPAEWRDCIPWCTWSRHSGAVVHVADLEISSTQCQFVFNSVVGVENEQKVSRTHGDILNERWQSRRLLKVGNLVGEAEVLDSTTSMPKHPKQNI
jgi:hypothetical protein